MKKYFYLIALVFLLTSLSACRSPAHIAEVTDSPYLAISNGATLDQITQAIVNVGRKRKFQMKVIEPGHIEAYYSRGRASATMEVIYTTQNFSIIYKNSVGLDYNSTNNTINPHYNKWMETLKKDISNIYIYQQVDQDNTNTELRPPKPELTESI